jgi:Zn-dependent alcohol dehydrogenase
MEMTEGMMADKVIMTPGVMYGDLMALGTQLAGKGGTIVVTGVAPITRTESSVNLFELAMWNKEINDGYQAMRDGTNIRGSSSTADPAVGVRHRAAPAGGSVGARRRWLGSLAT